MKKLLFVILPVLVTVGIAYFVFYNTDHLPDNCIDRVEGSPVITNMTPTSGTIGTDIILEGCNFNGFEGDIIFWIENVQGERGILYGTRESTHKRAHVTLERKLCSEDTSYSDLPCENYLELENGAYTIYTAPWGKMSNGGTFLITP